jgi:peptidyl-dipeptidase Dcp
MSPQTADNNSNNPLITAYNNKSWNTPDEAIDFSQLKKDHFIPAIELGIEIARQKLNALKCNKDSATFDNTIIPYESCSELLEQSSSVYFNLFSAEASEELQSLAQHISPKLAAFSSEVNLDADLFKKIKQVHDHKDSLNAEQKILVEKYYLGFIRNGALLDDTKKEVLKKIDQELSTISPKFSEHVLKATNEFELWLEADQLSGLPESAKEAMAFDAEQKGKSGKYLVTLHAPSLIPFLQYSEKRDLREKLWRAFNSRAFKGQYDNSELVLTTVRLREQRAQLLGFKSHAEYVLKERMAKSSETVLQFLNKLLLPSKKAADRDLKEVENFALTLHPEIKKLQPWDYAFYSEKLKEEKYKFNEEELRPYFKLENVINGAFRHAHKLFGIEFTPVDNIPKYHPDVTTYEVRDEKTKEYIGLLYADFFPRPTKKAGGWMTSYREQGTFWDKKRRPHISIVCNFTKPTPTKPSLLTYDEVHTLFHEFGHALHGLLSNCNYRSLAGTNVYWDFVELPSQLMENWVREKESLDLFAKHYETNEPIPEELIAKIKKSNQFQSGYTSLRQLNFALLDMSWHTMPADKITNVDQFENETLADLRPFPKAEGTNTSCSFSHIFAGGYSAGYYSYKWAEVLDADAFEFFKQKGIYNAELGKKLRDTILSRGGTDEPMNLYKQFRGQEPDPNALLRRDGLV